MAGEIVCIGGVLTDELFFSEESVLSGTSNPARLVKSPGGVVCNIAMHLASMDLPVKIITILGNDADADWLTMAMNKKGVNTDAIIRVHDHTGKYAAILNQHGALHTAVCHDITEQYLSKELLTPHIDLIQQAKSIVADTNMSRDTLAWLVNICYKSGVPIIIEPVSVAKGRRLADIPLDGVYMLTPNEDELASISGTDSASTEERIGLLMQRGLKYLWVRKGKEGSVLYDGIDIHKFSAVDIHTIDSTGAGDAALAGFIKAWYLGWPIHQSIQAGHSMAYEVLQHQGSLIDNLDEERFLNFYHKYYRDAIK